MISGYTILREVDVYNILFAQLLLQIWCLAYLVGHMQEKSSSCII